jgi:sulfoxide reductase heme-binding subunit YedZ
VAGAAPAGLLIAGLALLHFFWMRAGKNDFAEVQVYAMIIGALLLERLLRYFTPRPRLSAR